MNYQRIYEEIINRGKLRIVEENTYYENHHIIPKCMGGPNDQDNLVKLTYREHFLCHWLLSLIYNDNMSLLIAFRFMAFGNGFTTTNRIIPSSKKLEEMKFGLIKTLSSEENKKKVRIGKTKIKKNKTTLKYLEFIRNKAESQIEDNNI